MPSSRQECCKPYFMVGAGRLASTVWKTGEEAQGWAYHFNLVVLDAEDGSVTRRFEPDDLPDLVTLVRVLAVELAGDGCMDDSLRAALFELAEKIDCMAVSSCKEL